MIWSNFLYGKFHNYLPMLHRFEPQKQLRFAVQLFHKEICLNSDLLNKDQDRTLGLGRTSFDYRIVLHLRVTLSKEINCS